MIILDCNLNAETIATVLSAFATFIMAFITWRSLVKLQEQNFENGFLNRMTSIKEARNNVYCQENNETKEARN